MKSPQLFWKMKFIYVGVFCFYIQTISKLQVVSFQTNSCGFLNSIKLQCCHKTLSYLQYPLILAMEMSQLRPEHT